MTEVCTTNSDLIECLTDYRGEGKSRGSHLSALSEHTEQLKEVVNATFDRYCDTGLHALKFYLLHHLEEDLERLGTCKHWLDRHLTDSMCTSAMHAVAHENDGRLG